MTPLRDTLAAGGDLLLLPGKVLIDGRVQSGQGVLVRAGRFAGIDDAGALCARHPRLTPVPLPDHLLMPGFIDTHTHLTQSLGKSLVFGEPSEIFRRIWVPLEVVFSRSIWSSDNLSMGTEATPPECMMETMPSRAEVSLASV